MSEDKEIVSDWSGVSMILTSCISMILITLLVYHLIIQSYKHNKKKVISNQTFTIIALISMINGILFCLSIILIRTNLIFNIHFNDPFTCKFTMGIAYNFLILNKLFMYLFFSFQIEKLFGKTVFECSAKFLNCFRALCCIVLFVLLISSLFVTDTRTIETRKTNITFCAGKLSDSKYKTVGLYIVVLYPVMDIIFSLTLLSIFVHKLRRITNLVVQSQQINMIYDYNNFIHVSIKSTIIVCTAILFSICIFTIGPILFSKLLWFSNINVLVNCYCIYLLFSYNQKHYDYACYLCKNCCYHCFASSTLLEELEHNSNSVYHANLRIPTESPVSNPDSTAEMMSC